MNDGPRRASLLVLFLTVFIDLLGFGIVLPLLPIYADQMTDAKWMVGVLMASFSAMQFLFSPLWGRISDRIGRRPVIMIGLAGSVVFYALFGYATWAKDMTLLFVSRIGAGIAGATIATAQAYIADSTTMQGRTKGMALIGAAFGLGFTFGPLVGLLAIPTGQGDPGPLPGLFAAGLSLLALLLAAFKLPESRQAREATGRGHAWFQAAALRSALAVPSVAMLLVASFVCVFSFGNFEATLSLLIRGTEHHAAEVTTEGTVETAEQAFEDVSDTAAARSGPFHFSFRDVCLTFAFIGLTLTIAQGLIVRRLAGRLSDATLGGTGALLEVAGFLYLNYAISQASATQLFVALGIVVVGFSLMTPSINALISRRSDPEQQGGILGLLQSANSLARILGPLIGVNLFYRDVQWPFYLATVLMALGGLLVLAAARTGRDYVAPTAPSEA